MNLPWIPTNFTWSSPQCNQLLSWSTSQLNEKLILHPIHWLSLCALIWSDPQASNSTRTIRPISIATWLNSIIPMPTLFHTPHLCPLPCTNHLRTEYYFHSSAFVYGKSALEFCCRHLLQCICLLAWCTAHVQSWAGLVWNSWKFNSNCKMQT